MAFATKYKVDYEDYLGVAWEIEFQVDPWGGAVTSLTPGVAPCVIRESSSDNEKYTPIIGSYCDIQLVYESAIDDLYTETSQEIKVIISRASTEIWYGFLSPGQFLRHFNQSKHYVSLTASDGLGELKGIKFTDPSDDPYYGQEKDIVFAAACLLATGLALNTYESVEVFETDYAVAATDSALAQTYSYAEKFWDEISDESADCYTVLSEILHKYGACIRQSGGVWWIYRPNSVISPTVRNRVFNTLGAYVSNSTYTGYDTIDTLGMTYMFADAEQAKLPGVGSSEVTLNPPLRSNLFKNGSFDDFTWDSGVPLYWTNSSATIGHAVDVDVLDIGSCVSSSRPTQYLYTTFNTYKAQTARLTLEWKAVYTGSPTYGRIMIAIIGGTSGNWTYKTNGTWGTSGPPTDYWEYDLISDGKASMTDYETLTLELPPIAPTGDYFAISNWEIRLYEFYNENSASTNYWSIKNAQFEVEYAADIVATKTYTFDGPNAINKIDKMEISQGDSWLNISTYDDMYYRTSSATGDGDLTAEWYIYGDNPTATTPIPIAELLAKQRVEGYTRSIDVINASFRCGTTLSTYKGIQDSNFIDEYGFNKTFCFTRLDRDTRTGIYNGTWVECPATYTDEGIEWASANYDTYTINPANTILVEASDGDGYATSDAYTAVAGETVRVYFLIRKYEENSDLPTCLIGGIAQTIDWGNNYLDVKFPTAGSKTIVLGDDDPGDYHNYQAIIYGFYSITGI